MIITSAIIGPHRMRAAVGVHRNSSRSCRSAIRGRSARAPRQPGCRPLALYTAAALGSARKSISAFAAIGCWDTYGPSAAYPVAAQFGRLRRDVDPVQARRVLTQDLAFDLE